MIDTSPATSSGIGFTGMLQIVFIILKLCNVIDWSWWWVLTPMWISAGLVVILLALVVVALVIVLLVCMFAALVEALQQQGETK